MTYTEKDWRRTYELNGIGTAMSIKWLTNGCPKCGAKTYQVTMDAWAYCDGCHKGFPTDGAWTNSPLAQLNEDGSIADIDFEDNNGYG